MKSVPAPQVTISIIAMRATPEGVPLELSPYNIDKIGSMPQLNQETVEAQIVWNPKTNKWMGFNVHADGHTTPRPIPGRILVQRNKFREEEALKGTKS